MKGYLTKAFVLRKMDLKEADELVTLLSLDNGKIKAIAKGIKKSRSRNVGNLELLNLVEIYLIPGKQFEIVTQVKVIESFQELKADLEQITVLYYLTELIDKLVGENESVPEIFTLLEDFLNWFKDNPQSALKDFYQRVLELKLIQILGFAPEVYACVKCRKKLGEKEQKQFNLSLGGILCERCGETREGIPVSNEAIKILRLIESPDFHFGIKLQVKESDQKVAEHSIQKYLHWVLARELKTLAVTHALKKV